TTKSDNYLNYVAEDGVLVRWGEEQLPLKIYISPSADRQELIALAKEAMGAWQVASKDKIRYEITEEPLMADIQVLWAPFIGLMNIEGENFYKEGNTQLKSQGTRVYHEVQIATYDMGHHPNTTTTLYHTLVHEFGHALGLRGHSDDPHDVMYFSKVPNQKGQLSQRDINTIRQLYDMRISNEP
ncbi:MAG: matrixin family metalloprotease, partial [Cyanobacteria bacterium]|nr:matrixin family metalloprotease [Cyanobacteriota bacterium]